VFFPGLFEEQQPILHKPKQIQQELSLTALKSIFKQWGIRGLSRIKNDVESMKEQINTFDPRILQTVMDFQYEAGKRKYKEVERAYDYLQRQPVIAAVVPENIQRQANEVLGNDEEREEEEEEEEEEEIVVRKVKNIEEEERKYEYD
jgi:hypothetical protein